MAASVWDQRPHRCWCTWLRTWLYKHHKSAPKVDSRGGDGVNSNPCQYCVWLFIGRSTSWAVPAPILVSFFLVFFFKSKMFQTTYQSTLPTLKSARHIQTESFVSCLLKGWFLSRTKEMFCTNCFPESPAFTDCKNTFQQNIWNRLQRASSISILLLRGENNC